MTKQKNIAFTIIVAAVLVVLLSFILPKNEEKYLSEMFWTRKIFAPENYNIVLMGDSRVYRGLSPETMQKELPGLKILNFGFSNGGLNPTMFEAAEMKLTKSKGSKIIVLGISANTITDYSKSNQQYLQELTRPREEVLERLYTFPVSYWFSSTSPEKLKQIFNDTNNITNNYYLNTYHRNGYVESDKFPIDTTESIPSYISDFTNYKVEKSILQALFRQVEKWDKKGITVVAFRPPVSQPMIILEDSLGLFNERYLSEGLTTVGGNWIKLNNNNYKTYDGSHLNLESTNKLSQKIAVEIKKLVKKQ